MATFRYHAVDSKRSALAGEVQATTLQQAIEHLEVQGWTVTSIYDTSAADAEFLGHAAVISDEGSIREILEPYLARLCGQRATLVPLLEAFTQELSNPHRRRKLAAVADALRSGNIDLALKSFGETPECWLGLLCMSEHTEHFDAARDDFLGEWSNVEIYRPRWNKMLAYPVVLFLVAILVFSLLSFLVIPVFQEIYDDFGLSLPWLTEFVLDLSAVVNRYWVFILMAGATMGLLARSVSRSKLAGMVGALLESFFSSRREVARIARRIAGLLELGLDVPEALAVAGSTSSHRHLRLAAGRLASEVKLNGGALVQYQRSLLGTAVRYAVVAEMPLRTRVRLLRELGACYLQRTYPWFSWLRALIEPLAIVVVGVTVGIAVLALMMPLVKLVSSLS